MEGGAFTDSIVRKIFYSMKCQLVENLEYLQPLCQGWIWKFYKVINIMVVMSCWGGPPKYASISPCSSCQRWAQLSRVPHFKALKFRWRSTSSTHKASVRLLNQNSGRRPFGLACTGMFINTDQSLSIFTGFQVEEVDPQRNLRTSKRGTLVNWAPLWFLPHFHFSHFLLEYSCWGTFLFLSPPRLTDGREIEIAIQVKMQWISAS